MRRLISTSPLRATSTPSTAPNSSWGVVGGAQRAGGGIGSTTMQPGHAWSATAAALPITTVPRCLSTRLRTLLAPACAARTG
jgi:hypothetical protein